MITFAVVPVKRFAAAKARLEGAAPERAALAEAMALDVLELLAGCAGLAGVVVVSDEAVLSPALPDPPQRTHSAAALAGTREAVARGAERVLLAATDTPALTRDEVGAVLAADEPVLVLLDRHGTGTNGLLLRPPDALEPSFGPGSAERHLSAPGARAHTAPGFTHDLDTPDDARALRALLATRPGSVAPRTRAVLGA